MIFDRTQPRRAYKIQLLLLVAAYMLLVIVAERTEGRFSLATSYFVAVAPALPIGGVVWAMLRFIGRSDEFVRALTAKRFIVASGAVYALATAWGFLELYAGVPDFPLYLTFPVFCGALGVAGLFIKTSR
jgi:hypothetical protein